MTRAAPDVEEVLSERALSQWAQAISHVAGHYRVGLFSRFNSGQRPVV